MIDDKHNINILKITNAINNAEKLTSKLNENILKIDGMSSHRIRHFLNNLLSEFDNVNYLEIGCWKGSTLISSCYNNNIKKCIAIDNWSQFGGPENEFKDNIKKNLINNNIEFYNIDCFKFDINNIKDNIDIYFYDGGHDEIEQYKAFIHYNNKLNNNFIAIVDDWNYEKVKNGTRRAFSDLKYNIIHEWELTGNTTKINDASTWWNGLYVALIRK